MVIKLLVISIILVAVVAIGVYVEEIILNKE
jgi:hypothetical protein